MSETLRIGIIRCPTEGLSVWVGNKTTGQLCLGEAIEQVIALLYPEIKQAYAMRTPEEWAEQSARWRARALEARNQESIKGGAA